MIIITSGAYVDGEFRAELGMIPPAFLPVGNRRLYEMQQARLRKVFFEEVIYLSLPEEFKVSFADKERLHYLGIEVIRVPTGLSLADSLLFSINLIGKYDESMRVLHGDTLLDDFTPVADILAIAATRDNYAWAVEESSNDVWAGYFSFSNIALIARELVRSNRNFVKAVRSYDAVMPLERFKPAEWLDFGHANSYYKARSRITTQRSFNELTIADGVVTKRGVPDIKIKGESQWFAKLPPHLKKFTPQLIDAGKKDDGRSFYQLEYMCAIPLNEAYVYGINPLPFWKGIFLHCQNWFSESMRNLEDAAGAAAVAGRQSLLVRKTQDRIDKYFALQQDMFHSPLIFNGNPLPSLEKITKKMLNHAALCPPVAGVLHGDMCFSNMIYDSRSDRLKLIDPRGIDDTGTYVLQSDITYDFAKLAHSVIGLYDFIIAGRYNLKRDGMVFDFSIDISPQLEEVQQEFNRIDFLPGVHGSDMASQVILLFLSMLPLHADRPDRQEAFIANAVRLYHLYFKE